MDKSWGRDKHLQLIEAYRVHPVLWNPQHPDYYHKDKKNEAWREIVKDLGSSKDECKLKMNSLLSGFRREKGKIKSCSGSGDGSEEGYTSTWFAYKPLLFLQERSKPFQPSETMVSPENEEMRMPELSFARKKKGSTDEIIKSAFDILVKATGHNKRNSSAEEEMRTPEPSSTKKTKTEQDSTDEIMKSAFDILKKATDDHNKLNSTVNEEITTPPPPKKIRQKRSSTDEIIRSAFSVLKKASEHNKFNSLANEEVRTPEPSPVRKVRQERDGVDEIMKSAFSILKKASERTDSLDECETYGRFVTSKLKTYPPRTRSRLLHIISNAFFRADEGEYDYQTVEFVQPSPSTDLHSNTQSPPPNPCNGEIECIIEEFVGLAEE